MSDTPETDFVYENAIISAATGDFLPIATAMLKQAKKLERERDEARENLAQTQKAWTDVCIERTKFAIERDKAISVAENLIEYAHECLVKLESWGHGYRRYEDDMERIREDIAAYNMMKEATK